MVAFILRRRNFGSLRELLGAAGKVAKLRLGDSYDQLPAFSLGCWPPDPRKVGQPSGVDPLSRNKRLPPRDVSGWKGGTEAGEGLPLELQNWLEETANEVRGEPSGRPNGQYCFSLDSN